MIKSSRSTGLEPDPVGLVCQFCRLGGTRPAAAAIGDALSKISKTAWRRTACRIRIFGRSGAQKFARASPDARSPIGTEGAEIAESPDGLHPVSETAVLRGAQA